MHENKCYDRELRTLLGSGKVTPAFKNLILPGFKAGERKKGDTTREGSYKCRVTQSNGLFQKPQVGQHTQYWHAF